MLSKLILAVFLLPTVLAAQNWNPGNVVPGNKGGVIAFSDFTSGSVSLTKNFASAFYRGDFLSGASIQKVSDRLHTNNRAGMLFNYGIGVALPVDSSGTRIQITLEDKYFLATTFRNDLYRLIFFGNREFAGKTANAAPFNFTSLRYQQANLALHHQNNFGFNLGYIKGENIRTYQFSEASLTTHPLGYSLEMNVKGEMFSSDTSSSPGIGNWAGNGFSTGAWYNHSFNQDSSHFLRVDISGLGMIWWNNRSLFQSVDTSLYWEGFSVDNLFQISDSLLLSTNGDSLTNQYILGNKGKNRTTLPAMISVIYQVPVSHRGQVSTLFQILLDRNYSPFAGLAYSHNFSEKFSGSFMAGTGGFGKLYLGAGADFRVDEFFMNISAPGLAGLVVPDLSADMAVNFKIGRRF